MMNPEARCQWHCMLRGDVCGRHAVRCITSERCTDSLPKSCFSTKASYGLADKAWGGVRIHSVSKVAMLASYVSVVGHNPIGVLSRA